MCRHFSGWSLEANVVSHPCSHSHPLLNTGIMCEPNGVMRRISGALSTTIPGLQAQENTFPISLPVVVRNGAIVLGNVLLNPGTCSTVRARLEHPVNTELTLLNRFRKGLTTIRVNRDWRPTSHVIVNLMFKLLNA